jgi:predicted outer membrane repeat protein
VVPYTCMMHLWISFILVRKKFFTHHQIEFLHNFGGNGGAVFIDSNTEAAFESGNYFKHNVATQGNSDFHTFISAGGAVYSSGKFLVIKDALFNQNSATREGGAIYSVSDLVLNLCEFQANESPHGGAVVSLGNLRRLQATKFIDNWAGRILCETVNEKDLGGAIMLDTDYEVTIKENNTIIHNMAFTAGGGIYIELGKMIDFSTYPSTHLAFVNNYATVGTNWASRPVTMEIVEIRTLILNQTFYTNNITAFSNEPFSVTVRLRDGYNQTFSKFELLFVKMELHKDYSKQFQLSSLEYEREVIPEELEFYDIRITGPIGKTAIITFQTSSFELKKDVYVTLLPCPAGYYREEPDIFRCLPCPIGNFRLNMSHT